MTVVTQDENGDSVYTEIDVSATLSDNTAKASGGGIYILSGTASLSVGEISGNKAARGGGIYICESGEFSIHSGTFSGNTATVNGNGIYSNGIVSVYADATLAPTDDIYLLNERTVDIKESFTDSDDTILTVTPEDYEIGIVVLTGTDINLINHRIAVSNSVYFVNKSGILETNEITVEDTSYMSVDYNKGLIWGIDLSANTVGEAATQIENDITSLVFVSSDGTELTTDSPLHTGCKVHLYKYGEIIDTKTYVLFGDVDRDGHFDGTDAVIIKCIAAGMLDEDAVGSDAYLAADADLSGSIDSLDADLLRSCGMLDGIVAQSKE